MVIKLVTCIGTDTNISNPNLVDHFIAHYQKLGITNWSLTLHSSGKPEFDNLATFAKILNNYQIPYTSWIGQYDDVHRVRMNNILIARHSKEDWFIGADFDEFIDFPCSIPEYLRKLDEQGYNSLTGEMIDYIAENGVLPEIVQDIPLKSQFPLEFNLEKYHEIKLTASQYDQVFRQKKIAIKKPLQWWIGRHEINPKNKYLEKESPEKLKISHYPWDHLRLQRVEDIYILTQKNKPPVYTDEQYINTQSNRFELIQYLKNNNNKFNLT